MDVDVFLLDPRQFGMHLVGVLLLLHVHAHLRRFGVCGGPATVLHRANEKAAEEVVKRVTASDVAHS